VPCSAPCSVPGCPVPCALCPSVPCALCPVPCVPSVPCVLCALCPVFRAGAALSRSTRPGDASGRAFSSEKSARASQAALCTRTHPAVVTKRRQMARCRRSVTTARALLRVVVVVVGAGDAAADAQCAGAQLRHHARCRHKTSTASAWPTVCDDSARATR
jgi:hypothetical protein